MKAYSEFVLKEGCYDVEIIGSIERLLTRPAALQTYRPTPVVFTTDAADAGDHYIVGSGEADLPCRITHLATTLFA